MRYIGWLALLLVAGTARSGQAADFRIHPGTPSRVEFVSKAPMETVTGRTQQVSGEVRLEPDSLGDSLQVRVEVDLASLDTGIDLRDRHMRENHLHTDAYPKAVFTGGRLSELSATQLAPGVTVKGTIDGTMELHGKRQPLRAALEMTLQDSTLHIVTRFRLRLSDYAIPRPQFLVMRLDETQSITADLTARAAE